MNRTRMLGLAVGAAAVLGPGAAASAGTTLGATVKLSRAVVHTYHAPCEYIPPTPGSAVRAWTVRLFVGPTTNGERSDLEIDQLGSHSPVGHVDLHTTKAYRVAFYDIDGSTWGAGWQSPGHLGSGTAVVGARLATGRLTATLKGVSGHPAPLRAIVTWRCHR